MSDITISKCLSCGQEMRGTDYLDLLRRELAEARKDAERYRWLRECQSIPADILLNHHEALDAAIDAARREHG